MLVKQRSPVLSVENIGAGSCETAGSIAVEQRPWAFRVIAVSRSNRAVSANSVLEIPYPGPADAGWFRSSRRLDGLARVAILFVSLGVPFHQTDDGSSLRFGSMIKGLDVFNDLKTIKVGSEALESPQEPQAQEF